MRNLFSSIAVVAGLSLSVMAQAQLTPGLTVEYSPLDSVYAEAIQKTVYNGIAGPYAAFAPASGVLGVDDYASIAPPSLFNLAKFQFIGGVRFTGAPAAINRALQFEFYDSNQVFVKSFSVALPSSGDFNWTITIGNPAAMQVPNAGFVQARTLGTSTGRWFLTPTLPTVGSNSLAVGGAGGQYNHAFAMVSSVPEPGSVAMMVGFLTAGAGMLARRRRK